MVFMLILYSFVMDGSDSCQNVFMDLECMSCPSCISLQQVINYKRQFVLIHIYYAFAHQLFLWNKVLMNYDITLLYFVGLRTVYI